MERELGQIEREHKKSDSLLDISVQERGNADQITAILDLGAKFEGRLSFEGTVKIGGEFRGEIFTHDTIIIGQSAWVQAEIEAETIVLSGRVDGNLFAKRRVIMHPPAVFRGTVTSPSLRIDEGVVFEGASYMPRPVHASLSNSRETRTIASDGGLARGEGFEHGNGEGGKAKEDKKWSS